MRRPKGIKTKKSVAKRFKITATGKVKRSRAGRRHLLAGKSPKRRRSLGKAVAVSERDAHRIQGAMPFSHRG
jgi:large subunit ribosomal protein L35